MRNRSADKLHMDSNCALYQRLCCHLSLYLLNFNPLATFCGCKARYLVRNPEDTFSRIAAHIQ